jgi:hypothetical protein|tara:strand:- start:1402 stop:1827 length:426 start_codon:yes stop_codon:yes gene_type:complete
MSAQPLNLYDVDQYTSSVNGAQVGQIGTTRTVEYRFPVTALPTTGASGAQITMPVGAVIRSGSLIVESTLSGGTNITLGVSTPAGGVTDANGLLEANTGTAGVIAFDGALLNTALAAEGQLTVATSRTAGVVKVVIVYDLY